MTAENIIAYGAGEAAPLRRHVTDWRAIVGVWLVVEIIFGVLSVVRALHEGKPTTFDLDNYEYYSGFAMIHGFQGSIALPGQLQTYLDPPLNAVYYLLITHLSPMLAVAAIAFLQSLPVSVASILVWRLADGVSESTVVPAVAGLLAGAAAFLAPTYMIELGETSSDSLLALPLIVAVALLYRVLTTSGGRRAGYRDAALAGLLLGITTSLKLTTAPYVVAIVLAFAVALLVARTRAVWTSRRCLFLMGAAVAVAFVSATAVYLPEALMLWHRYRDPLFPYFNGIFHSPYLQAGNYRDPRWVARSPTTLWLHYSRLFVGGDNRHNGTSQWPVRSPVVFFALAITAVMLVMDLIRWKRPEVLFLELSLLGAFLLSEIVFGIYRYLAPVEMTAVAVLISLLFLHRLQHTAVVLLIAGGVALGSVFAIDSNLGSRNPYGSSYFAIRGHAFADLSGAGVILAGPGPLGYLVPFLPANTVLVRAGGDLDQVMSTTWWTHVAAAVRERHVTWWVVYQAGTRSTVPAALRQIGLPGTFGACHLVSSVGIKVRVCPVTAAS